MRQPEVTTSTIIDTVISKFLEWALLINDELIKIWTSFFIGLQVNKHRRVDSQRLLRLVEHKIPELTSWMSQLKTDDVRLPLASQTLTQITCIQSALTCFFRTDQLDIDLNSTISKVKLLLDDCIENEINERVIPWLSI